MEESIRDLQIKKLRLDAKILKLRADGSTGLEKERFLIRSKIAHLSANEEEQKKMHLQKTMTRLRKEGR